MYVSLQDRIAALRTQHSPGVLLAVRMGDFFEFFGDDAAEVSNALGITLTARGRVPMCGVPILWGARLARHFPGHRMEIANGLPVSPRPANDAAPCAVAPGGDCILVDPDSIQFGDGAVSTLARPLRSVVDDVTEPLSRLTSIALEVLPVAERRQLAEALRQKLCLIEIIEDERTEAMAASPRDRVA
jgi:hypothetical protein